MIITSTLRSQRQFRSTFVDVFETRQISVATNRRARSEQLYTCVKHDRRKFSSDAWPVTHLESHLHANDHTGPLHEPARECNILDQTLTELHVPKQPLWSKENSTVTRTHIPNSASQPNIFVLPTSDANHPTKISANVCSVIGPCESVTAKKISEEVQKLVSIGAFKPSAQKEWERLWYHSIDLAFQKIASQFPEIETISKTSSPNQSISEPTLNISSLKQEDRKLFEEEERSYKRTFSPRTEAERLIRLQCARNVTDAQERIAILLGLPTYDQYHFSKSELEQKAEPESLSPSKRQQKRQARFAEKKQSRADRLVKQSHNLSTRTTEEDRQLEIEPRSAKLSAETVEKAEIQTHLHLRSGMSHQKSQATNKTPVGGAEHRPLVVGLTKPSSSRPNSTMASSADTAALNKEISENVKENTAEAAPAEDNPTAREVLKPKKEKAPKQPKPQKPAPVTAPTAPAIIDLRVGHILRAIAHPNADSLYVSTIAMGDPEGTEHTQVDAETGKVVRTVCSGLNGLVPLEEMQDRKIIVVANLKPVNMRSIKSAAMVLAASPKQPEGADPHAADRVVELVLPPESAEAGDKVYFEGWPYGEGKGPEKQLNPKKKQWEAIQPGFFTGDDLVVGFDASKCEEVDGDAKGNLVVEGKGVCTVKTLKGAVVR